VVGLSSHGKSSFINVLVGQHILCVASRSLLCLPYHFSLISTGGAATAWPVVVRHIRGKTTPVLTLDTDRFEAYIALMRKHRFSKLSTSRSRNDLRARNFLKMNPELARDLELFETQDPPFSFDKIYDTPEAISRTVSNIAIRYRYRIVLNLVYIQISRINNLMRACQILLKDPPPIGNGCWPTIEVEFECWRGQDKAVEVSIRILSMIFIAQSF
jgi:hypothetical protein